MANPTGQISCGMVVLDDWKCVTYKIAGRPFTECWPPGTLQPCPPPVCCNFPPVDYSDFGAGGLHCFGQPIAGTCNIPAGTWKVSAGGTTSPWAGTMRVTFSDGSLPLFEDNNQYNCGDFSEQGSPLFNSRIYTFAIPVVATLEFEHDNGQGIPYPTINSFICYECVP